MSTEAELDATCRRLRDTRLEIVRLAHTLKGDTPPDANSFPRSRLMRALTGAPGRRALGSAAMALAMTRPRMAWRLAGLAPLLRPIIIRYVTQRLLHSRSAAPAKVATTVSTSPIVTDSH
jgi:hypothetical protein